MVSNPALHLQVSIHIADETPDHGAANGEMHVVSMADTHHLDVLADRRQGFAGCISVQPLLGRQNKRFQRAQRRKPNTAGGIVGKPNAVFLLANIKIDQIG